MEYYTSQCAFNFAAISSILALAGAVTSAWFLIGINQAVKKCNQRQSIQ